MYGVWSMTKTIRKIINREERKGRQVKIFAFLARLAVTPLHFQPANLSSTPLEN